MLCAYLLNHFLRGEAVSAASQNSWKSRQRCVGVMLEVWHVLFYTLWTHTVVCVMTLLTDKAAQVKNQWANSLMLTHRIYRNDKDIWKHLSFLNATYRPLCINGFATQNKRSSRALDKYFKWRLLNHWSTFKIISQKMFLMMPSTKIAQTVQNHHNGKNRNIFKWYLFSSRGQKYLNIALVLQDEWLTTFTHPANACICPLKAYAIKNISE